MIRLFTALTGVALTGTLACSQNAARDIDQPVSARPDTTGVRDTTSPAYKSMQRSDSATLTRTDTVTTRTDTTAPATRNDTTAMTRDSAGHMVTPPPAVRDTTGTQPATNPPPR